MAGWMLPNDGPLTEPQRLQALDNFRDYCEREKLSIEQVGRKVGKPSTGTIYDLLNQRWNSESDKHIRILNNWIEQHARQQRAKLKTRLVDTHIAMDIKSVADLVRSNQTMGLAWGPSGIGKSKCADALHDTIAGSILISIADESFSRSGVRNLLYETLGGKWATAREKFKHIVSRLKDSERLIIIDEAHKLRDSALEFLREVHDQTGCPVLCLATKDLFDRIRAGADPDAGQLYSRFEIKWPLVPVDKHGTGKRRFTVDDIRKLYAITPIRLSKDAEGYLVDLANDFGKGSLRRCRILLTNAVRRARKRQNAGDSEEVTVTADDLAYTESRFSPDPIEQQGAAERRSRAVAAG